MSGGSLDLPSSGSAVIAKTLREIQASNEKSTKRYLIITIVSTFASTIFGILIGKFLLT